MFRHSDAEIPTGFPAAARRVLQRAEPSLHRAHAGGLGSAGQSGWKQTGETTAEEGVQSRAHR